eukprot:Blabericola_migrator_1__4049@NODE_2232_length_3086_cov_28_304405_g1407_i0_p1_GENE_NODE_2232_length_3086_cov_28_304405_g1407_i0NODE_2232_length_3086_cov_28_304405_g1407_i0_p1_ORF_typecomplete_len711_score85_74HSA/PF07529_13/7_6e03HSA/PF07529_13/2_2e03HSA/PF07529_13/17HSA/PF07529_13/33_NODE_2232_length_3086_cov_28_304405_g1407_i08532985
MYDLSRPVTLRLVLPTTFAKSLFCSRQTFSEMSARRLQQPAPLDASSYRWAGTSIVTTLAVLPEIGSVSDLLEAETEKEPKRRLKRLDSIRKAFRSVLATTSLSRSASTRRKRDQFNLLRSDSDDEESWTHVAPTPPATEAVAGGSTDSLQFLDVQKVLADFKGLHVPAFLRPESLVTRPKVGAVREVLDAYENGSFDEALIKTKFPTGDFQQHLFAYLRHRMTVYKDCRDNIIEARLIDAYVTGMKEWCAAAHDLFISRMEWEMRTYADASEAAKGQQVQIPYFQARAVLRQKHTIDYLANRAFKDNSSWHDEWRKYKKAQRLTHSVMPTKLLSSLPYCKVLLKKSPHFISWLLRSSSPQFFLEERQSIAEAIKRLGGPSYLINVMNAMFLHAEDVAQYKRWRPPRTTDDTDQLEASTTLATIDVPKVEGYLEDPWRVFDLAKVAKDFNQRELPPFLQLGCGLEEMKMEAVDEIINLHAQNELDQALSLMKEKFPSGDFYAHFFATLRRPMRSYAFLPGLPKNFENSTLWYPYQIDRAPGNLLYTYITGLQRWCANVHEALKRRAERAIEFSYNSQTEQSKRSTCIQVVRDMEPKYTRILTGLMRHIDPKVLDSMPSPPKSSIRLDPEVAKLQEGIHVFNWLVRNMPWDCFLFWRGDLASAVRELDRGLGGFSFLASVLESLSFTDCEADEFGKYYNNSDSQPAEWTFN